MGNAMKSSVLVAAVLFFLGQSQAFSSPKGAAQPAGSIPETTIPSTSSTLAPDDLASMEKQMFDLINRDRAKTANAAETAGESRPLRWNDKLAAVARAHSEDMLDRRYFSHMDPDGVSPAMRITRAGIEWHAQGENIALHYGVVQAETAFMDEPPSGHNHRANILNPKYTEVGIGIARGPDGMYYITQEFVGAASDDHATTTSPEAAALVGESDQAPEHLAPSSGR